MLACDWSKQKQAITKPSGEEVISHPKTCSSLRSCLSECLRSDTDVMVVAIHNIYSVWRILVVLLFLHICWPKNFEFHTSCVFVQVCEVVGNVSSVCGPIWICICLGLSRVCACICMCHMLVGTYVCSFGCFCVSLCASASSIVFVSGACFHDRGEHFVTQTYLIYTCIYQL